MKVRLLPWSDSCFVCGEKNPLGLGVRFEVHEEEVRIPITIDPRYEGYPGHVHGGVVTALLDEIGGWACTVVTKAMYFTAEITVRFRAPVPAGVPLLVRARYIGLRHKLATGEAWIEDATGKRLAEATGRFLPVPAEEQEWIVPQLKMPGRSACQDDL